MATLRDIITGPNCEEKEALLRLQEKMADGQLYHVWAYSYVCSNVLKLTWEELLETDPEETWDWFIPDSCVPADGTRYVVERNTGEGVGYGDYCTLVPIDKVEVVQ